MITMQGLGTTTELVAPNIAVKWNPTAATAEQLGTVDFAIEKIVTRDGSDPLFVVSRDFVSVISAQIADLLAADYTVTDPATGEQAVEPGWKLMAMIKAVVDHRLQLAGAEEALPQVAED
ncbi:hypothetical protein ARC20_07620 [Stenotrophomonas panacihumi]|uniref:Uncharacterized protein n=1 Tax=Stenotrophomonas panacihumi TaxID=676599 RepID=A0A0R0AVL1_9GAMM|nr:hypothetical protein [Stenotrophomonas panacihumi]KRG45383.1 hypothetical protein ARC20_07620 [Stenotrophomonas panacihumi]PTN54790.1 hypothetical protein C9J98_08830 [Stenotrophomonas panacihumi]